LKKNIFIVFLLKGLPSYTKRSNFETVFRILKRIYGISLDIKYSWNYYFLKNANFRYICMKSIRAILSRILALQDSESCSDSFLFNFL